MRKLDRYLNRKLTAGKRVPYHRAGNKLQSWEGVHHTASCPAHTSRWKRRQTSNQALYYHLGAGSSNCLAEKCTCK